MRISAASGSDLGFADALFGVRRQAHVHPIIKPSFAKSAT